MKKVVCIGGGIGTVNLLHGLKNKTKNITVIVSVADEGGSGGRIRRLYKMHPPGDVVSCLAALMDNQDHAALLAYRLPGDRYAQDHLLEGHKVGNIMLAAASQMSGSFEQGVEMLKQIFHISANVYAATKDVVSISAKTIEGQMIEGEETIDLGKYAGKRVLEHIYLHPSHPEVDPAVVQSIEAADIVIAGPGDLYTNNLPVLIVPQIRDALMRTQAKKYLVVNVANKPFETKGYTVHDFIAAISIHMEGFPFDTVIINNNFSNPIPKKYQYTYVRNNQSESASASTYTIVEGDIVDETFPLYHDSEKLANVIWETV